MTAGIGGDVETARAIERAVLDYFEGWFDGDAARMEAALHPELAKRIHRNDALESITAQEMVDATAEGLGRALDVPDRAIEIEITHIDGAMATAVVHSALYIEYIHLAETREGWKIVNTLWRRT